MKIYLGAAVTSSKRYLPRLEKIKKELVKMKHKVMGGALKDRAKVESKADAKDLYKREIKLIDKADLMIAEVTMPSWGTAFLMEYALDIGKPVLVLFYKDNGGSLPIMIKGHPELYVEHYDEDNLHAVLKKNLSHFKQMKRKKGKLIVIDGADGSGKATQTKKLLKYLKKKRVKNKYISFPRYYTSFHGKHTGRFLTGEFGGNDEVSPYLSSLAFALDRLTAKDEMMEWLQEGNMVIADRYVSANMAHQGSKMPIRKQKAFINWLYTMEYKEHKLPKEDMVIFLYVPVVTAQKLISKKKKRKYTKGKDKAEEDVSHQQKSVEMYRKLCKKYKHWEMINCVDSKGKLLSIEKIHQKILDLLRKKKIIKI